MAPSLKPGTLTEGTGFFLFLLLQEAVWLSVCGIAPRTDLLSVDSYSVQLSPINGTYYPQTIQPLQPELPSH